MSSPEQNRICLIKMHEQSEAVGYYSEEERAQYGIVEDASCPAECPGMITRPLIKIGRIAILKDFSAECGMSPSVAEGPPIDLDRLSPGQVAES